MRVFISYARPDSAFALTIRDRVQALGHNTWVDVDDIPKGAYWPDAIDDGLESCDVIVGVMTPESLASRNVKNEWDWAISNGKPLVLLMLRQAHIPHRYISINYIDCTGDHDAWHTALSDALLKPETQYINDVVPAGRRAGRPKTQTERNRDRMLDKVKAFWIDGVLENSLHGMTIIEIGMTRGQETVAQPWSVVLKQPDYPEWTLPPDTRIIDLFDKLNGKLLILGEPGSGKTTMLLELARGLLLRAQRDNDHAIPIIFNLSSWAENRPSIGEWIVAELSTRYQVPVSIGRTWLEDRQLLLLLDGLDEVRRADRDACVTAINAFLTEQGLFVDVAVCSRTNDYTVLDGRLQLEGAVILQPLTDQQIDSYLAVGEALAPLRDGLHRDPALLDLARSPLLLSILVLVYRHMAAANAEKPETVGTDRDRTRQRLFNAYVNAMLERPGANPNYDAQLPGWLAWLAGQMQQHGQTLFIIEGLQPDWLPPSRRWRWGYNLLVGGFIGGTIGIGFGSLLVLGVVLSNTPELWLRALVLGSVSVGGVAAVMITLITHFRPITTVERLSWSWRKAAVGLAIGLLGGLVLGLIGSPTFRIALTLALALAGAFVGGMTGTALTSNIHPNQGIRNSVRSALRIGTVIHLTILFAFFATYIATDGLRVGAVRGLIAGAGFVTTIGGTATLLFGALSVVQHVILRWLLYRAGKIPLNYASFLDYAADRVLLRKVGGGYMFIHRLLLEYFANRKPDQ